jgi:hypothetical protein
MDLGSMFIILAIFLLVALFISRPFFENTAYQEQEGNDRFSHLLAERERLLDALEELDFDHSLGKVAENAYQYRRQTLLQQGAQVLQELEEFRPQADASSAESAARAAEEDPLEAMIAARRAEVRETSRSYCPQCGNRVQKTDKFCGKCGSEL